MLKQHLDTCVVEAIKAHDSERVMDELWQLLRKGSDPNEETNALDLVPTIKKREKCCE
jgi:hypothetical protein